MPDAAAAFAPGDKVLVRDHPLLHPLIVDHVRTHFAGEPEPNGPVFCRSEDEPAHEWHPPRRYDQAELVTCPPGHESPPPAAEHWDALRWINRNRRLLEAAHGISAVALAEQEVRHRIILAQRIGLALAAEPDATAMRRAEIAFAEVAL